MFTRGFTTTRVDLGFVQELLGDIFRTCREATAATLLVAVSLETVPPATASDPSTLVIVQTRSRPALRRHETIPLTMSMS